MSRGGLKRKLCVMTKTSLMGDKPVNRIGFGAMQLAGPGVFGPPRDPDAALAVLRRAIELGVDHIDTAQYYGPDVVNDLIRDALYPYPEDLKLVTKVGGRRDDQGGWLPAQRPDELRAGVEDNLRTLRVDRMDLVNLRLMPGAFADLLAEQLGALEDLRGEGKLDLIGISEAGADQVRSALELVDIAEVQNSYSVVNRSGEDVLELCMEREIAFVALFPARFGVRRGPQTAGAGPGDRRRCQAPWSHRHPGSARLAARPLRADAADPWHQLRAAPRGEHGSGGRRTRRARRSRARWRRRGG